MSEPMKSEAIEDVLSSVRRLVSDNSSNTSNVVDGKVNKLLLTPEQRIPETNLNVPDASDQVEAKAELSVVEALEPSDDVEFEPETELEWSPDDRMANWDDVGSGDEGPEGDKAESATADMSDETGGAIARALAEALAVGAQDNDADDSNDEKDDDVLVLTPEDVKAEQSGSDTYSEDNVLEEEAVAAEPAPMDDLDQELAELSGNDIEEAEDTPQETPVFSRVNRAEERVAELGAQIDAATGDDALEDHIEDLGHRAALFGYGDDESVLDEEGLREIISQVVREELQGVLGQRITRNVRKMVRREIRMTLAAEDLE